MGVRVLEVGSGKPVLMVPGGSGDAFQFAPLMAELPGWRFIAVNRPGGGLSDAVDVRRLDLRQLAVSTLLTVLDSFGLERAPVISSSMGGLWSFWLALDRPERVSSVVQMGCPALVLNTSAPLFMRLLSVPGVGRLIAPSLQPKSPSKGLEGLRFQGSRPEDIDKMPQVLSEAAFHFFRLPTYLSTYQSFTSATMTVRGAKHKYQLGADQVRRIQQPVLLLWGDNDPFGNFGVGEKMLEVMPHAKLLRMRAGHLPFLDNPASCGEAIREFLHRTQAFSASSLQGS